MSRARAALLLVGIFLLGAACGAFGAAAWRHMHREGFSPERMERHMIRRLSSRLELDATQRAILEKATHRARTRLEQVRAETLPRIEAILDDACDELRPALRPEQQEELQRIRSEARERLRRHEARAGPEPGQ